MPLLKIRSAHLQCCEGETEVHLDPVTTTTFPFMLGRSVTGLNVADGARYDMLEEIKLVHQTVRVENDETPHMGISDRYTRVRVHGSEMVQFEIGQRKRTGRTRLIFNECVCACTIEHRALGASIVDDQR